MKLDAKLMVITGGGSGIGRALVIEALSRGAKVAALDLDLPSLEETAQMAQAGDRLGIYQGNITDRPGCAALCAQIQADMGPIDGLINNAGVIQPFVDFAELDMAMIDRMVAVNLVGPINMTKAFLPALMARPEAHLINVASMGGFLPFPGQSMYSAAKAGVKTLTEALYQELRGGPVQVSCVMPGAVDTGIVENSGIDMPAAMADAPAPPSLPAADAARIILDGVERGRLHILVGRDAKMLFRMVRFAPRWTLGLIEKQMGKLRK